ncbi:uncharacterized protein LOC130157252 [Falco biarmicus]|uniref:uncharacterized protein LOC130157252 n=1 Tax=Falco biarmicus TaxID=345155 RepID=UPI0024BC5F28|nr:uncharacterized protein LOC130157252 [Falco biarmicus]
MSRCSPCTLWFCQVLCLEITLRKKNGEGMVVTHQHRNDKSDRALGLSYWVLQNSKRIAANPPSSAPLPVDEKVLGSSMLSFCCWFQQWGKAFSMAWPLRAAEDGGFWSGQSRRHEHRACQPSVVTTPACSTSAKAFEPLKKLKEELILLKAKEWKRPYQIASLLMNVPAFVMWPFHRLSFFHRCVFRRLLLIQASICSFAHKRWSRSGL